VSAFTDAQVAAFGQIVADNFGANIQTGFWSATPRAFFSDGETRLDLEGCPYVATQIGPNYRVDFHVVKEDGEVVVL
jgi:hypothetical protein